MMFLICEIKFTVGKSKEMVFTAGKRRGRWGTRHFGGNPPKIYLDKTLDKNT